MAKYETKPVVEKVPKKRVDAVRIANPSALVENGADFAAGPVYLVFGKKDEVESVVDEKTFKATHSPIKKKPKKRGARTIAVSGPVVNEELTEKLTKAAEENSGGSA